MIGSTDELYTVAYEELRRLVASVKRGDAGATINPTVLVHEAWLKLAASPRSGPVGRLHFKRIAARAMRDVLVNIARRSGAGNPGDQAASVRFDDALDPSAGAGQLLALDTALKELARVNPRHALMIESRWFGGLDVSDMAVMLGVTQATILRDWHAARAWLAQELRRRR
jgi:RNA polymerase sigma factor (TIGR02999 family)